MPDPSDSAEPDVLPVRMSVTFGTGPGFEFGDEMLPDMLSAVASMVMLPGGVLPARWISRLSSKKIRLSGGAAHISAVLAPEAPLTLVMFRFNRVPEPDSGVVPSFEKAEMRSVLIGPGPGRTLPETFQLLPVTPTLDTGGSWKLTTVESNVKSPWNPIR